MYYCLDCSIFPCLVWCYVETKSTRDCVCRSYPAIYKRLKKNLNKIIYRYYQRYSQKANDCVRSIELNENFIRI